MNDEVRENLSCMKGCFDMKHKKVLFVLIFMSVFSEKSYAMNAPLPPPAPELSPYEPMSAKFLEQVQKDGMTIAQNLVNENIFIVTADDIIKQIPDIVDDAIDTSQEIAYLMGYVQTCIEWLQANPVPVPGPMSAADLKKLQNTVDVIRALKAAKA